LRMADASFMYFHCTPPGGEKSSKAVCSGKSGLPNAFDT